MASAGASGSGQTPVTICSLPNELLSSIFQYLSPTDLANTSRVCRRIAAATLDDTLWQAYVAHLRLDSPKPYHSYKELYLNLREHLYLAPHLWFSNQRWRGSVYAFRYNTENGNIEGVPVFARSGLHGNFSGDPSTAPREYYTDEHHQTNVSYFRNPKIHCMDSDDKTKIICNGNTYYDRETGVMNDKRTHEKWITGDGGVISLGRPLRKTRGHQDYHPLPKFGRNYRDSPRPDGLEMPPEETFPEEVSEDDGHDRTKWPPLFFPAREQINLPIAPTILGTYPSAAAATDNVRRTDTHWVSSRVDAHPIVDWDLSNPSRLPRVYIRERNGKPIEPWHDVAPQPAHTNVDERFATETIYVYKSMSRVAPFKRPRLEGKEIENPRDTSMPFKAVEVFSKIHPSLYTKNTLSPPSSSTSSEHRHVDLSGIWLGDYFSHGPELLLFTHPNVGDRRLEAMKLTGDPNVPRGELTFLIPNLVHPNDEDARQFLPTWAFENNFPPLPTSFIRHGHPMHDIEEWWHRPIYKGQGQLAHQGFARRWWNDIHFTIIDDGTENPDKNFGEVAMNWLALGHVSRARRVNVERILFPYTIRKTKTMGEKMTGGGEGGVGIVYSVRESNGGANGNGNDSNRAANLIGSSPHGLQSVRVNTSELADFATRYGG